MSDANPFVPSFRDLDLRKPQTLPAKGMEQFRIEVEYQQNIKPVN